MIQCQLPWARLNYSGYGAGVCCMVEPGSMGEVTPVLGTPQGGVLSSVWNGPLYQRMRSTMFAEGRIPVCGITDDDRRCEAMPLGWDGWWSGDVVQCANATEASASALRGDLVVQHYPVLLELVLDLLCPLRCIHCVQASDRRSGNLRELDIIGLGEEFHKFVRNAAQVVLLGGEPTISPQYQNVVRIAREQESHNIHLITNGLLLESAVIPNIDVFSSFHVSVDAGTEETYRRIRIGSSWGMLLRGLLALKPVLEHRALYLHNVVTPLNVHEIPAMVELEAQVGANKVGVSPYSPAWIHNANKSLIFESAADLDLLRRQLRAGKGRAAELGVAFAPSGFSEEV